MMSSAVSRRARELAAQRTAFVTATVVRAQRPTSSQAGDVALVLADGTIEGFVGGVCAEHSVRVHGLQVIASGEPLLLRILPDAADEEAAPEGHEMAGEVAAPEGHEMAGEGAVTVQNPCLSGGAMEIFLEPVLPEPRVVVVGETPIATALLRIGAELGLNLISVDSEILDPSADDLALVVASHGRDELHTLRRGLESGVPYVGLVASRKRGTGVIAELRDDGVSDELLELIDVPAGIDIGARTPAEIALSILARIVAVRRGERPARPAALAGHAAATDPAAVAGPAAPARPAATAPTPPTVAVDPICGMTVAAVPGTPSVQYDGETFYFCCDGCKAMFEARHEHAIVAE